MANVVAGKMNITAKCLAVLDTGAVLPELDRAAISRCLLNPVWDTGNNSITDIIQPGKTACFVVSDYTRKTAIDKVLPVTMDLLKQNNCSPDDMIILIASGIHRHPSPAEIESILGTEMFELFKDRIHLHDPDDESARTEIGRTGRGHPVKINSKAVESDHLILTGAATYHYHAGFGGGRKSLVPGIADRSTIAHNHSLTLHPD